MTGSPAFLRSLTFEKDSVFSEPPWDTEAISDRRNSHIGWKAWVLTKTIVTIYSPLLPPFSSFFHLLPHPFLVIPLSISFTHFISLPFEIQRHKPAQDGLDSQGSYTMKLCLKKREKKSIKKTATSNLKRTKTFLVNGSHRFQSITEKPSSLFHSSLEEMQTCFYWLSSFPYFIPWRMLDILWASRAHEQDTFFPLVQWKWPHRHVRRRAVLIAWALLHPLTCLGPSQSIQAASQY